MEVNEACHGATIPPLASLWGDRCKLQRSRVQRASRPRRKRLAQRIARLAQRIDVMRIRIRESIVLHGCCATLSSSTKNGTWN